MNITLIGMPGSGKSFVGGQLAERLGFSFIDIDKTVEKEFGLPLQQVVERLKNDAFLDKEAEVAIKSTDGQESLVVSPGGSIIYRTNAMNHLRKISKIFYLRAPLEVLEKRIGNAPRGIVIAKKKTFADLYNERASLYEEFADYTLDGNKSPEDIIEAIISTLDPRASVLI